MSTNATIKIAIVDDHPMVLEGLKSILSKESYDVYAFTKGAALLDFIQSNSVQLILLDMVLNDTNGIDICKKLRERAPDSIIVGISNQAEKSIILEFIQAGGNGYILKNSDNTEIVACIQQALHGNLALSQEAQRIILQAPNNSLALPKITKREKQILQAVAKGHTSAQIADQLFISLITVETHRRNLMQKFKVKNMIELIHIATENKLFE